MNTTPVLFSEMPAKHGKLGLITLNRPEALNALSTAMILALSEKLHAWADDASIHAVIIQGAGDRAFCAGGDLKEVYMHGPTKVPKNLAAFFIHEYRLIQLIREYPKPYIALVSGVVMGGGVGLAVHGTKVVVAEDLKFAMPETSIGLYPDVGASFFLSRCPHHLGMYLGLTGNIISASDTIYCGLAQWFDPKSRFAEIIEQLSAHDLSTNIEAKITAVIAEYTVTPETSKLQDHIEIIDSCFSLGSVEAIIAALQQQDSAWAQEQAAIIKTRSPSSLKVTHRAITLGAHMNIAECMAMESNLTFQLGQRHDFHEGIRAALIDKTRDPKWQPAQLADISDAMIDDLFTAK